MSDPSSFAILPLMVGFRPLTAQVRPPSGSDLGSRAAPEPALGAVAKRFEAVFWSEMLRHAGLARPPELFGGGAGEANFAPMLVQEYAGLLAREGRTGIADRVEESLWRRTGK